MPITPYRKQCLQITGFLFASLGLFVALFFVTQILILLFHVRQLVGVSGSDVAHALILGFRFDLKLTLLGLAPMFIGALVGAGFTRTVKPILTLCVAYASIVFVLMLFLSIANFFNFDLFGRGFDTHVFLAASGNSHDFIANWNTLWDNYPIGWALILLVTFSAGAVWVLVRVRISLLRYRNLMHGWKVMCLMFVVLALYIGFARGALGTFPLRYDAINFSDNTLLDSTAANAVLALDQAFKDEKQFTVIEPATLAQGAADYKAYTLQQPNHFSLQTLFGETQNNPWLIAHKPNVVFVQMESMGNHFIQLHNPVSNNLLGALGKHFRSDYVFRHFLSGGNGTEPSLSKLVVNASVPNVLFEPMLSIKMKTSIALPYERAGYQTVFLTSGDLGWGNFGSFFKTQGFDRVIGKYEILKRYPKAKVEAWGVYDQYVFAYANALLKQANRTHKPIFIYINTITNHPPYGAPPGYHALPLNRKVSDKLAGFMHISKHEAYEMMLSYQYVNNALGRFIDHTQKSPWGSRTIIGASGDHNQHEMIPSYTVPKTFFFQHSVPFVLHVPKAYVPLGGINVWRVGSHKDIFPTLMNLSLSHASYFAIGGSDLAAARSKTLPSFGLNDEEIVLSSGIIHPSVEPVFYPFVKPQGFEVKAGRALTAKQMVIYKRIQAYQKLIAWQINYQAYIAQKH